MHERSNELTNVINWLSCSNNEKWASGWDSLRKAEASQNSSLSFGSDPVEFQKKCGTLHTLIRPREMNLAEILVKIWTHRVILRTLKRHEFEQSKLKLALLGMHRLGIVGNFSQDLPGIYGEDVPLEFSNFPVYRLRGDWENYPENCEFHASICFENSRCKSLHANGLLVLQSGPGLLPGSRVPNFHFFD